MSDSDTPNKHTVTAPFNPPNGDVILRSSDKVDFYVFKAVLSLSSQFFSDLFSLPQPPNGDKEDEAKRVVDFEEEARYLDYMLRFLYPCPDPVIQLEDADRMLDIARKYELPIIAQRLEVVYMRAEEFKPNPVHAYLTACRYKWRDVAKSAARATLKYSIEELVAQDVGMTTASISQYRDLLSYHTRVRTACRDMCDTGGNMLLITTAAQYHSCDRQPFYSKSDLYVPDWFIKYVRHVRIDVMLRPSLALDNMLKVDAILREIRSNTVQDRKCPQCSAADTIPNVMKFVLDFRQRLSSVIDSTPLDMSF